MKFVKNLEDVDKWDARPCEYTWEELCKAAESLDPTMQPLRRKGRASAVAGSDIRGAQSLLIRTSKLEVYKEKFTEEDLKSFEHVVKKARQDLDLHKDYLSNTKIIKYYSSVERVMEKIPQFDLIADSVVKALVQDAIWTTKDWYMTDLLYQFALFLPKCKLVNDNQTADSLKRAKVPSFIKQMFIAKDPTFTEKKFQFLRPFDIAYELKRYYSLVEYISPRRKEMAIKSYNNYVSRKRKVERKEYMQIMKTPPIGFWTPIHFLVCKERDKGYPIQEPFLELTKIRAYFGGFVTMPETLSEHLAQLTTYRALRGGAVKFEGEYPIREIDCGDEEPMESEEEIDCGDEEPMESEEEWPTESEEEEPVESEEGDHGN